MPYSPWKFPYPGNEVEKFSPVEGTSRGDRIKVIGSLEFATPALILSLPGEIQVQIVCIKSIHGNAGNVTSVDHQFVFTVVFYQAS